MTKVNQVDLLPQPNQVDFKCKPNCDCLTLITSLNRVIISHDV